MNALYEADRVALLGEEPEMIETPSASGKGQKVFRCPRCRIAVWSNYPGAGPAVRFVRVGTMDDPATCPPDVHIFTSTKLPWVVIPDGPLSVPDYYDVKAVWPAESLDRWRAMRARG
jgi:hypothetical protein